MKVIPASAARSHLAAKTSEEVIQQAILAALRALRLRALQTTHRVKMARCPHCGQTFRPGGSYGADLGVPDILVTNSDYPTAVFTGLEVKTPTGRLSPAQKELVDDHRIHVVRSVEEAIAAVKETEKCLPK